MSSVSLDRMTEAGVGMALALKSWLLGIMFGMIFCAAINRTEKKKLTK